MLNRKSNFTLIELIVVIVVLGILAAIVIPNISSFSDEARDVQLTADARNMQTAVDMFRAKSDSGTADPTVFGSGAGYQHTLVAAYERIANETTGEYEVKDLPGTPAGPGPDGILGGANAADDVAATSGDQTFKLINTDELKDKHLRKLPKYVKNAELATGETAATTYDVAAVGAVANFDKGQVVAGILENGGKSTAIVKFVAAVEDPADKTKKVLAVVR